MRFFLAILALTVTTAGCKTLKNDPSIPPNDLTIQQLRLEFSGCGAISQIGTAACYPTGQIKVVTEFPGTVSFISNKDCGIKEQVLATPPMTEIGFTGILGKLCNLIVVYSPDYPVDSSGIVKRSLQGELTFLGDEKYDIYENIAITDASILHIGFKNVIKGAFVSRQFEAPVLFKDSLDFKPKVVGSDLLQIKLWKPDGSQEFRVYPANYYSHKLKNLTLIKKMTKDWIYLTYDEPVSFISSNFSVIYGNKGKIPASFTGITRAYTAAGRTLVTKWTKGVVDWEK